MVRIRSLEWLIAGAGPALSDLSPPRASGAAAAAAAGALGFQPRWAAYQRRAVASGGGHGS